MKRISARRARLNSDFPTMQEISAWLDNLGAGEPVAIVNWSDYSYKPSVRFNIAFSDREIFIRFDVDEDRVKAEMTEDLQPVYEDSCVEFFISPADDGSYYNFEFNSIGTCLMGFGPGRAYRELADSKTLSGIRRLASSGTLPFTEREERSEWSLTVAIPYSSFFRHKIETLKGKIVKANFYKCGDGLSVPHYLSWNWIDTEKPDFHRPEFFGEVLFEF